MSSEPSSPAFNDPEAPLRQKIKFLEDSLEEVNANFAYYEESNQRLEEQVEQQTTGLERRDAEIANLKEHIQANKKEHDETHQEFEAMRRRSSVLEQVVKSNDRELRSVGELERIIEDREAEVRLATAELNTTKTERDDKVAEIKGLEGDIETLKRVLVTNGQEIESLHERIGIYQRHIPVSGDLAAVDLDDVLYEFMEKYSANQADGRISLVKKYKRASTGGFNLADEFDALSDEEDYDSGDGGYDSDGRSIRSFVSDKPTVESVGQVLGLSGISAVEIHPSIGKSVDTAAAATRMSPVSLKNGRPVPKTMSSATQTSPPVSPKKNAPPETASMETQTSPPVSPKEATTPETASIETQTGPVASPKKATAPETVSSETQTSPIAALIQKSTPAMISSAIQTSSVATSPRKIISEMTNNGVQTSRTVASPKKVATETANAEVQTSPTVSSPSRLPLPPSPFVKSPVSAKSPTAKSPLSNQVTEEQLTLKNSLPPQPAKPSKVDTLKIKRPRVPTKEMSPQTLSHYKAVTVPKTIKTSSPSTSNIPGSFPTSGPDSPTLYWTAAIHPIWQQILHHGQWILLYFFVTYFGASMAASQMEWKWAQANGYAPESRAIFVASRLPGQFMRLFGSIFERTWNLVFGGWNLADRLPLSPG